MQKKTHDYTQHSIDYYIINYRMLLPPTRKIQLNQSTPPPQPHRTKKTPQTQTNENKQQPQHTICSKNQHTPFTSELRSVETTLRFLELESLAAMFTDVTRDTLYVEVRFHWGRLFLKDDVGKGWGNVGNFF